MLFARRVVAFVLLLLLLLVSALVLPVALLLVLLGWVGHKTAELFSKSVKAIAVLGNFQSKS
jgi:hypothetical protein